MSVTYLTTWIHIDTAAETSVYPQVEGAASHSPQFQKVYWRCVVLFFAFAKRTNSDLGLRFRLYTNASDIPDIDGVRISEEFKRLNVEIISLPLTYLPPVGYYSAWRNQFYVLDVIQHISATHGQDDDRFLILDSDCLLVRDFSRLSHAASNLPCLTYDPMFGENEHINGLTSAQMAQLYAELDGVYPTPPPRYLGGEFLFATVGFLKALNTQVAPLWQWCLDRNERGEFTFYEEAHFLSYLYHRLAIPSGTANAFVKRMWTGRKHQNTCLADMNLTIWHLPAEKRFGFRRLFPYVVNRNSWFWNEPDHEVWLRRVGEVFGVPRRSTVKMISEYKIWISGKAAQLCASAVLRRIPNI